MGNSSSGRVTHIHHYVNNTPDDELIYKYTHKEEIKRKKYDEMIKYAENQCKMEALENEKKAFILGSEEFLTKNEELIKKYRMIFNINVNQPVYTENYIRSEHILKLLDELMKEHILNRDENRIKNLIEKL